MHQGSSLFYTPIDRETKNTARCFFCFSSSTDFYTRNFICKLLPISLLLLLFFSSLPALSFPTYLHSTSRPPSFTTLSFLRFLSPVLLLLSLQHFLLFLLLFPVFPCTHVHTHTHAQYVQFHKFIHIYIYAYTVFSLSYTRMYAEKSLPSHTQILFFSSSLSCHLFSFSFHLMHMKRKQDAQT